MDTRKTQTIGSTDYVSVYTYSIANPELRDKYEYIRSAEMDQNSRIRLAEDKARTEGIMQGKIEDRIEVFISMGMDHSQILSQIKEIFKLSADEAERYIEQVFNENGESGENGNNANRA